MEFKKGGRLSPQKPQGPHDGLRSRQIFRNFVKAVLRGFLAMNEQTQRVSARATGERCRTRLDGPKVDIRGLGSTVVVPPASAMCRSPMDGSRVYDKLNRVL